MIRLNEIFNNANTIYRGNVGPYIILPKSEDVSQASQKFIKILQTKGRTQGTLFVKTLPDTPEMRGAEKLYGLLTDIYEKALRANNEGINFNLIKGEAKNWAELAENSKISKDDTWADKIIKKLKNTGFLISKKADKNQKFSEDIFHGESFGIKTKVKTDEFSNGNIEDFISKVYCQNKHGKMKWQPPEKTRKYWEPCWKFTKDALDYLKEVEEKIKITDVFEKLKNIGDKYNLI